MGYRAVTVITRLLKMNTTKPDRAVNVTNSTKAMRKCRNDPMPFTSSVADVTRPLGQDRFSLKKTVIRATFNSPQF
jgi:hypothetical protein